MAVRRPALGRMLAAAAAAASTGLGAAVRAAVRGTTRPSPTAPGGPAGPGRAPAPVHPAAGADFEGRAEISYSPHPDGLADPGEVVWTWVPFEEDPGRGKDRPVLVIGLDGASLLALPLTSKDHDRDAADEARRDRHWIDIGSGGWDPRGRPSEVRVDRILRVDPAAVRRIGATLPRELFDQVADEVRLVNGWGRAS